MTVVRYSDSDEHFKIFCRFHITEIFAYNSCWRWYFHVCKDFHLDFYFNFRNILLYGIANSNTKYDFGKFFFFSFLFCLFTFAFSTFEKDTGWLAKNFPKLLRNCAVIPSGHFYSGKYFSSIKLNFLETSLISAEIGGNI